MEYLFNLRIKELRKMSSKQLKIGLELISEWRTKDDSFFVWDYSNEEKRHVILLIKDGINFILNTLADHGKIDKTDRCVMVIINDSFDKVIAFIDPVESYDVSEVLMASSQAFQGVGGWKEGNVNFDSIVLTKGKHVYITKVSTPTYLAYRMLMNDLIY
jgi:hypothetical protein